MISRFFVGMAIGALVTVAIFFVFSQRRKANGIVAPYYEEKVFTKPIIKPRQKDEKKAAKVKLPIIMYHYVEHVKDDNDLIRKKLNINPGMFERQLALLRSNDWKTYFVRDIPDILDGKMPIGTKSAVLSFDDGYEDFYTVVFPLLKKYEMKATLYMIVHYIDRKGFLKTDQLKELVESGLVELGSHTLDHVYLKSIPKTMARQQIFKSKQELEERFGVEVKTFAYPYGAFTDETINLVKEASYSAAVSVVYGTEQSSTNQYYLSRVRAGILGEKNMITILESLK